MAAFHFYLFQKKMTAKALAFFVRTIHLIITEISEFHSIHLHSVIVYKHDSVYSTEYIGGIHSLYTVRTVFTIELYILWDINGLH